ncbi:MAG: hypothetical protein RL304_847, partial [Verrucomicrobiota bacterium]
MSPGVRPSISRASLPTAIGLRVLVRMATTLGSRSTTPRSLRNTRVLAVPRSMPMAWVNSPGKRLNIRVVVSLM